MPIKPSIERFALAPAALAVALVALSPALLQAQTKAPEQASQAAHQAGRIVFAIGDAKVIGATGATRPAVNGEPVAAGERVVTGREAYVHLRMVDEAFIAVRPESTLAIDLYDYDAASPKNSRIRLQLDSGNTRTVSGRGGEAAKDRYRFNTPVAAIGLRGTDYTVRAVDDITRVSVSRGAVAVTPLGADCSADTLGPCASAATRELSAGLPHAYMQVSARQPVPELVAPEQDPAGGAAQNPANRPGEPNAKSGKEGNGSTDTAQAGTGHGNGNGAPAANGSAQNGAPTQVAGGGPAVPGTPETVSEVIVDRLVTNPPPEPGPAKLVWGRWSSHAQGEGSPAMVELLGPDREITYANAVFGLLRSNAGDIAMPSQGTVGFRLDSAEAYVLNGGNTAAAEVLSGRLSVDFRQRAFDTALAVGHAGGVENLHAKGSVQATGLFASDASGSNMKVVGALARDASEAAYLFDKPLSGGGGLLGAVRWLR